MPAPPPPDAERHLARLLRATGAFVLLAIVPLWMPGAWIAATHRWLGLGEFPAAPIAEYLARSVSALCAFYGGLLVCLSTDVRRYLPLVRYQALAIMALTLGGVVVGRWAGMPWWFVGSDAVAGWICGGLTLALAGRVDAQRPQAPVAAASGATPDGPRG